MPLPILTEDSASNLSFCKEKLFIGEWLTYTD